MRSFLLVPLRRALWRLPIRSRGGTAELSATAPQAEVRVDYPIDDVILDRPVALKYRYAVTVIRANGQQDRDTQPREGSAAIFFVSVVR